MHICIVGETDTLLYYPCAFGFFFPYVYIYILGQQRKRERDLFPSGEMKISFKHPQQRSSAEQISLKYTGKREEEVGAVDHREDVCYRGERGTT